MKNFFIKLSILCVLIVCIDLFVGKTLNFMQSNAKGGMTYRDKFICNELETDILLCGSSRCVHHYNPKIITDSLHLTCYNSGQDGNGIIMTYGRLEIIMDRMTPKAIVYDVIPEFDLLGGEDNHKYLTWLKPYYDHESIKNIFLSVDKTERFKMMSQMYRYNSHIIEVMADFIHPIINTEDNGYVKLEGEMDKLKIKESSPLPQNYIYDPLKLEYINKLIDKTEGKLIFVVSPIWYGMDTTQIKPLMDICKQKGIPFLDFSNDSKYVHNDLYFKDGNHLNERGADEFTRDLVGKINRDHLIH